MLQFNGKEFLVYDMDTREVIIDRLAVLYNTIPRFLYFTTALPEPPGILSGNYTVVNVLNIIKHNSKSLEFSDLYDKIEKYLDAPPLHRGGEILRVDEVYELFIVYNKDLDGIGDDMVLHMLMVIQNGISTMSFDISMPNADDIWKNRKKIKNKLDSDIRVLAKQINENDEAQSKLQHAVIIPHTSFELEHTSFILELSLVGISLIEIFNLIHVNKQVPFVSLGEYYKIVKDFEPHDDWSISLPDAIVLKVLQLKDTVVRGVDKAFMTSSYNDSIISIEDGVMKINMFLDTMARSINQNEYIQIIYSIFPTLKDLRVINNVENKVKGVYYYPRTTLNNYVLSDLIMNNPLFSSVMAVDESIKASKDKQSIYIHFNSAKTKNVTINVTEKVAVRGDPMLRGKDIVEQFKPGTHYLRVKITHADNQILAGVFMDLFSKYLSLYDIEKDDVIKEYKKYIPTFGNETLVDEVDIYSIPEGLNKQQRIAYCENNKLVYDDLSGKCIDKLPLKNLAPEVFTEGYPPLCNDKPSIIADDLVEKAQEKGYKVMTYPKSEDEGFPQRNYICKKPNIKYPGLRDNPLSNNFLVPYLPCCYKSDHSKKRGIYQYYYYDQELEKKDEGVPTQQEFIVTNKFVARDKLGVLPNNILQILQMFSSSNDPSNIFYRKGVSNSESSLLECVIEGSFDAKLDIDDEEERLLYLYEERDKLSSPELIASGRQEMYDYTNQEIIDNINDTNIYLDPSLYINILENIYDCNIYVFTRRKWQTDATMTLPRFTQSLYKTKRRSKSVFIYQHMGSKSDHATQYRCELIVKGQKNNLDYNIPYDSPISRGVKSIQDRLHKSYALNKPIVTMNQIQLPHNLKWSEQGIDSYGKCRMLRLDYKNHDITLLTTPMQPLVVKEVGGWVITKVNSEIALDFFNKIGAHLHGQRIIEGMTVAYIAKIDGSNITLTIPIEEEVPRDGLDYVEGGGYPEIQESVMDKYNKNKKISRYLVEYAAWMYSGWINKHNRTNSLDSIISFQKRKLAVEEGYIYPNQISKTFSMKSSLIKNGKLIVSNEETLKRLIWSLRLKIHNEKLILDYHNKTTITDFYQDITDFDQYQNQVILQGENSVNKWIRDIHSQNKILHNSPDQGSVKPYFFYNKLVSSKIFLAQNTSSVEKAITVYETWTQNSYNPGYDVEPTTTSNFTLYSVHSMNKIVKYKYGNGGPKILGYKVKFYHDEDDEKGELVSEFTALLPL